jgi:hypothetical protein
VTGDRRRVRVAESLFEQLERLLPADRGPNGEPSITDFLVLDLPAVVDRFATDFDVLPEALDGVPSIRALVTTGRLVGAFVVYGIESADGSVDLIAVELDP